MSARRTGKRGSPAILRKSHAHTEGKGRAKGKRSLREELVEELERSALPGCALVDLDGVVYEGDRAVLGAAEAVEWLAAIGLPHLFLTNTTSRPRSAIVAQLARMHVDVAAEEILTPPIAAASWLAEHMDGPVALFVPEATRSEFEGLPISAPGAPTAAVVVGDYGDAWTFAELNRAFRLLMREPRPKLVALGMTRYWKAPDGLRLDTAPFVTALAQAAGIEPIVLGKPAAPFFAAALEMLDVAAADAVMIGDDIRADIQGAQNVGIKGILVKTGKYRDSDLRLGIEPWAMWESLAELPERLSS